MYEAVSPFRGDSPALLGFLPREYDTEHHCVVGAVLPRKCDRFIVWRFVGGDGTGSECGGKCSVLAGTQIVCGFFVFGGREAANPIDCDPIVELFRLLRRFIDSFGTRRGRFALGRIVELPSEHGASIEAPAALAGESGARGA